MALSASEYQERVRLLEIANEYRDNATRAEALQERDTYWGRATTNPE
jgi:hypothetical protein